jgi:hypothetical protein
LTVLTIIIKTKRKGHGSKGRATTAEETLMWWERKETQTKRGKVIKVTTGTKGRLKTMRI